MKLHLVDGTYELFRAHFGAPPRRDSTGREVGASYGLMRSLYSLVRDPLVTHIAVAFDHEVESFRNRLFEGYKTGEGTPEELSAQFDLAEDAARALGIVVWPMIEHEADDALATAAARWRGDPRVEQVVICSPDKDLAQCVRGTKVVELDRRRERLLDEDGVRERFGVDPTSIPDWLALVGDKADGIPGVARWGAKSTSIVLGHYRDLEAIPDDVEQWEVKVRGAAALAANLKASREDAMLYRELATLVIDVPLEETLEDLEWGGVDGERLGSLAEVLGDARLVERFR